MNFQVVVAGGNGGQDFAFISFRFGLGGLNEEREREGLLAMMGGEQAGKRRVLPTQTGERERVSNQAWIFSYARKNAN